MSKVPCTGHLPSLEYANGISPSSCIFWASASQLVLVGRNGVTLLLEQALAVVDRPWVVAAGHEVLLAVVAGRCGLEALRVVGQVGPDIGDVAGETLLGEEAHAIAREPCEHVVGLLQICGDVVLEAVVVDEVAHVRHTGRVEGCDVSFERLARRLVHTDCHRVTAGGGCSGVAGGRSSVARCSCAGRGPRVSGCRVVVAACGQQTGTDDACSTGQHRTARQDRETHIAWIG